MSDVKILIVNPWKKIIGRVVKSDENSYTMKDGYILEEIPVESGIALAMIPIIPSNDFKNQITILKSSVIVEPVDAPNDLERNFVKTTCGLLLP